MTNSVIDTTLNLWRSGRKTRTSQSGWISSNAPCCSYNGESADTRGRGGLIQNGDSVSYHCFNCGFKTSYTPGRPLTYKFRKLLTWLGADENTVRHLVIEAIRVKEQLEFYSPTTPIIAETETITYEPRALPEEAVSFHSWLEFYELANQHYPTQYVDAVQYANDRSIDLTKYDLYWTPQVEHKLNYRVIVPFTYKNQIVGYTARSVVNGIVPKYYSNHPSDFVFNTDQQSHNNKIVIVTEGAFDAMSIDGVAVLSNECSEKQADVIDSLGKVVIVVPDFDITNKNGKKTWPGATLIDRAIEYGWNVAFPLWSETCKDVNDAVVKYGRLFVLKTILDSSEHNKLKIQLMKRKILNG